MTLLNFLFCKLCMEIITMNSYQRLALMWNIWQMIIIDVFCCFVSGTYILVIIILISLMLCFPSFWTVSYHFLSWCFCMFPGTSSVSFGVFLLFPHSVIPLVSSFRSCAVVTWNWNHSLFHMKITVNVKKSSHEDRVPCYLHLPVFFFYKHSSYLL